jgi:hypothetical protein
VLQYAAIKFTFYCRKINIFEKQILQLFIASMLLQILHFSLVLSSNNKHTKKAVLLHVVAATGKG